MSLLTTHNEESLKKCKHCGNDFARKPNRSKSQWKHAQFCSRGCGIRYRIPEYKALLKARWADPVYKEATAKKISERVTKHGMVGTTFGNRFRSMKYRCTTNSGNCKKFYKDKGIKVLWKDFNEFKKDMYEPWLAHVAIHGEKNTTLDRIDSSKGYYKENCRWATRQMQSQNRSFRTHEQVIEEYKEKIREWAENNKSRCKITRRGAWIVEYGNEHAVFGELKKAREFSNGHNQALSDLLEFLSDKQ